MSQLTEWMPTADLRRFSPIADPSNLRLQQKWVRRLGNNFGIIAKTAWRDVPVVCEQRGESGDSSTGAEKS